LNWDALQPDVPGLISVMALQMCKKPWKMAPAWFNFESYAIVWVN
jgi:hypothetical protein